jgi:hypothetical protein
MSITKCVYTRKQVLYQYYENYVLQGQLQAILKMEAQRKLLTASLWI